MTSVGTIAWNISHSALPCILGYL